MKLLLTICIVVTLLHASMSRAHAHASVEWTNAKTNEYAKRFGAASISPFTPSSKSSSSSSYATGAFVTSADVSTSCASATISLVQTYLNCSAFTDAATSLWSQQTGGPSQASIHAYCTAPCKLAFNTKVAEFVAACTSLEIIALEYASRNDAEPFHFYSMLSGISLPCVSIPDTTSVYGKEYCLQSFVSLWSAFGTADAASDVSSATLDTICVPCLAVFLAEYARFATPASVKEFAFIDVLCTKDSDKWCIIENREIDAMPSTYNNETAVIARATRVCSTRCLPKILVKIVASQSLFNTSAEDVVNARRYYAALNGLCATNAAGEYCSVTARRFDDITTDATAAGCVLDTVPSCANASCKAYTTSFIASQGCCYTTLANTVINYDTGESVLTNVTAFAQYLCGVTIPSACTRVNRGLVAAIVINNIRWAYYLTAIAAFRAAVLLDIAAALGVRPDDITATFAQSSSTSAHGFATLADANSITVSIVVATDTTAQATSVSSAYDSIMATNSLSLQSTSALTQTQYNARADPSQPVGVTYSTSSTTSSSSSTGSNVSGAHGMFDARVTLPYIISVMVTAVMAMLL